MTVTREELGIAVDWPSAGYIDGYRAKLNLSPDCPWYTWGIVGAGQPGHIPMLYNTTVNTLSVFAGAVPRTWAGAIYAFNEPFMEGQCGCPSPQVVGARMYDLNQHYPNAWLVGPHFSNHFWLDWNKAATVPTYSGWLIDAFEQYVLMGGERHRWRGIGIHVGWEGNSKDRTARQIFDFLYDRRWMMLPDGWYPGEADPRPTRVTELSFHGGTQQEWDALLTGLMREPMCRGIHGFLPYDADWPVPSFFDGIDPSSATIRQSGIVYRDATA